MKATYLDAMIYKSLPQIVTVQGLADILGLTPPTIRQYAREGKIPAVNLAGGGYRFQVAAVLAALGLDSGEPHYECSQCGTLHGSRPIVAHPEQAPMRTKRVGRPARALASSA